MKDISPSRTRGNIGGDILDRAQMARSFLCVGVVLWCALVACVGKAANLPNNLTVCGLTRPQDLAEIAPVLRWDLPPRTEQKAFQILLGTSANIVAATNERIFDSGWIESSDPSFEYAVADNTSVQRLGRLRQPYYWTVRIRDAKGVESDWAAVEDFALRRPCPRAGGSGWCCRRGRGSRPQIKWLVSANKPGSLASRRTRLVSI